MLVLSPSNTPLTTFTPSVARAPVLPVAPVAPALGHAFDAAWHHHGSNADERLMEATFALVRRLKHDGLPPEKALIAVKTALAKYADLHCAPSLDEDDEDADGLERVRTYRRVFGWFIEAYYPQP
jgi:hypothetical protein